MSLCGKIYRMDSIVSDQNIQKIRNSRENSFGKTVGFIGAGKRQFYGIVVLNNRPVFFNLD
jgi:hypothetical protein